MLFCLSILLIPLLESPCLFVRPTRFLPHLTHTIVRCVSVPNGMEDDKVTHKVTDEVANEVTDEVAD